MFETQKVREKKTSSGEIDLNIGIHASSKVGQEQVSGGVCVLCWHATYPKTFLIEIAADTHFFSLKI